MNSKEAYRIFCETEKSIPLFLSYKWLSELTENWEVVLEKKGEEIVAAFPYILFKKKGFTIIDLPPLTVYGGPWIKYPPDQKYTNKITFEKEIMSGLIQQLPAFDFFNQKFHPGIENWTPFYWQGFNQTTKYTYIIEDLQNLQNIYTNFSENARNKIRKAEKTIHIELSNTIDILCELKGKASEEGLKINVSENLLKKIFKFCQEENCGEVLIGRIDNKIHCAALFVWDKETIYYLYGVSNPEYKTSGAISLLLWEAIKRYSSHQKQFNFEGSMIEGVERFFRGFGGRQVPYHHIQKTNSRILKIRNYLKDFIG